MNRGKKYVPERVSVAPGPVTVTRLPVVRCAECGKTLAHPPGHAADVLTAHYRKVHQP